MSSRASIFWIMLFILTGRPILSQAQKPNSPAPVLGKNGEWIETVDPMHPEALHLRHENVAAAITLLKNKAQILPIRDLAGETTAYLALGTSMETPFQQGLSRYLEADLYFLPAESSLEDMVTLQEELKRYSRVVAGVHPITGTNAHNFGITAEMNLFLRTLVRTVPTIVAVFGNVYSLAELEGVADAHGLVAAYQGSELAQDLVSQVIFGGLGARGILPV